MKRNEIIGEHKKGVRAKIYNKKGPEPRHVSKRPQQGPVATAFAEEATLGDYQPGRTATIKDPEHGKEYTLDLTKPENMAALHPNEQGELEFNPDFDPAGGGLGATPQGQEQVPLQPGAPITIKTATAEDHGDIGGDGGDDFIDDVVDHDFERAQGRLRELAGVAPAPVAPQAADAPGTSIEIDTAEGFKDAIKQAVLSTGAGEEVAPMIDKMVVAAPDGTVDTQKTLTNVMGLAGEYIPQMAKMVEDLIAAFENAAASAEFASASPEDRQSVMDAIQEMKAQLPAIQKSAQDLSAQLKAQNDPTQAAVQKSFDKFTNKRPDVQESKDLEAMLRIAGLR